MGLGLTDASLLSHLSALANHRSSKVRHRLAFHLSRGLPPEFCADVYRKLLRDKNRLGPCAHHSIPRPAGLPIGLGGFARPAFGRAHLKVIQALDFWIPLLETGYRVDPSPHPGRLLVTTLIGSGIASRTLETDDPCDPRIPDLVSELRSLPF